MSAVTLSGFQNAYRLRRGDYRVVYELHDDRLVVLVIRIGHRREVYRNLR
jgi:mRNA interferase RelE/StbE